MPHGITLDHHPFQIDESYLPCLINGVDGSGASNFSISLAAELIQNKSKLIFFSAYKMAREKLLTFVEQDYLYEVYSPEDAKSIPSEKSLIIKSGDLNLLSEVLNSKNVEQHVFFIKNIEKYQELDPLIWRHDKLLLSGSIADCAYQDKILEVNWKSKIIFSPTQSLPLDGSLKLGKYESYLVSAHGEGILRLIYAD
jgi:hypothetical protein